MKPELTFDFQIRKTWIQVAKMYNELVAQKGITTSIGMALLNIDINDGIRSTALGPKMGLESTSLSRVLKSMKNQGLIVKESDPEDKRSVLIKLTDAGLKKRNMARHIVLEFNQLIEDKIGEKRSAEFLKTIADINRIVDNIKSS